MKRGVYVLPPAEEPEPEATETVLRNPALPGKRSDIELPIPAYDPAYDARPAESVDEPDVWPRCAGSTKGFCVENWSESEPEVTVYGRLRNGLVGRLGKLLEKLLVVDVVELRRRCSLEFRSLSSYSSLSVSTLLELLLCIGVGLGVVCGLLAREPLGERWVGASAT